MMKAITLWQPWASLIALEAKRIETRSWATNYRGLLAIHSAKVLRLNHRALADLQKNFNQALTGDKEWNPNIADKLPLGKVLAIANLVDCVEITPKFIDGLSEQELAFGDYSIGRFAWLLKDVNQLKEPIPTRGYQRLWNFDETPHLVSIDPWVIGSTKIWTPKELSAAGS